MTINELSGYLQLDITICTLSTSGNVTELLAGSHSIALLGDAT